MKILIPVLGYARSGGARVLSEFANVWVRSGHDVTFLAPDTATHPYFPTNAKLLWAGPKGRVRTSTLAAPKGKETGFRNLYCLWRGLRKIGGGYDIVLANHSLTAWPILLSGIDRKRVFYYIQAYEPQYFIQARSPLSALLSKASYWLPFRQIVNSEVYFGYKGIRATEVVPFGIDLRVFRPRPARPLIGKPRIVLGCIGRSEPAKGTPYVLAAFERLASEDTRYWLKIAYGNLPVGWSHPRAEVVVPQNDADLAGFYRSVDVMVAAGIVQHGAPHYPVLEAMASGTPVVNTGYVPATPTNSWLAVPKDVGSLVQQVREVVADPAPEVRTAPALEAVQAFEWQQVGDRMMSIFESAT